MNRMHQYGGNSRNNSKYEGKATTTTIVTPKIPLPRKKGERVGPDQDVTFFYTPSHLSELQNFALPFPANFNLFSHLNSALHNLVTELCCALKIIYLLCII